MRPLLLLPVVGALFGGCQLLYQPPALELTDLRMSGMGLQGTTITAYLRVGNPNFWPVNVVKITYDLTVEGDKAGNGVYDRAFTVPAGGTLDLEFPLKIGWGAALGGLKSAFGKGSVESTTKGVITLRAFFGDMEVPYEIRGKLAGDDGKEPPPPIHQPPATDPPVKSY